MFLPSSCPAVKIASTKKTVSSRSLCDSVVGEQSSPQVPKTFSRPKLLSSVRNSNSVDKSGQSSSSIRILFEVKPSFSMVESRGGDLNQVSKVNELDRPSAQKRKTLIRPSLDYANLTRNWKKKASDSTDSKVTDGEIEEQPKKDSTTEPLGPAVSHVSEQQRPVARQPASGISFKQLLDCDLKHPIRVDLDQLKEKMKQQSSSSKGVKPILIHSSKKQFFSRQKPLELGFSHSKSNRQEESSTELSVSSKRVSFSRNMMVRVFSKE